MLAALQREGAPAVFAGDQVDLVELVQGLPDGGPADVEVFGELVLGWELLTWLHGVAVQESLQVACQSVVGGYGRWPHEQFPGQMREQSGADGFGGGWPGLPDAGPAGLPPIAHR